MCVRILRPLKQKFEKSLMYSTKNKQQKNNSIFNAKNIDNKIRNNVLKKNQFNRIKRRRIYNYVSKKI